MTDDDVYPEVDFGECSIDSTSDRFRDAVEAGDIEGIRAACASLKTAIEVRIGLLNQPSGSSERAIVEAMDFVVEVFRDWVTRLTDEDRVEDDAKKHLRSSLKDALRLLDSKDPDSSADVHRLVGSGLRDFERRRKVPSISADEAEVFWEAWRIMHLAIAWVGRREGMMPVAHLELMPAVCKAMHSTALVQTLASHHAELMRMKLQPSLAGEIEIDPRQIDIDCLLEARRLASLGEIGPEDIAAEAERLTRLRRDGID